MPQFRMSLLVCAGTGCVSNNSFSVKAALEKELASRRLQEEVQVVTTGCNGFCANGPIVVVKPDGIFYQFLKAEDIPHLVEEHCLKGRPVPELMYTPAKDAQPIPKMSDIPFFGKQRLIALANRGLIDPENIDEYIALGGYQALSKALLQMSPEGIVAEVKASGLRGRGGAGFPTGMKWEYARAAPGERKYVVCNADEGEPGTFKDRVLLTELPDRVFAGMTIAGYAIGARQGILYLRGEYAYLLPFLENVLARRRADGLLGRNISGKHAFEFDIRIQLGAGAYVCGEETALLSSCEGGRGDPRNRPPFPAQHGYLGCPTVVNNVETLACVTRILEAGPASFCEYGSDQSSGTKLLSLSGDCGRPGVYEVPFGISLREVLALANARDTAAVQVGGPSGQMVGPAEFDRKLGFEDLATGGALVVFGPGRNLVEIAQRYLEFFEDESCGYCTPCRVGNVLLRRGLERVLAGRAEPADLAQLESLGQTIKATSRCGLGQTSPNPLLSSLQRFRPLYGALVRPGSEGRRRSFDLERAVGEAARIRTGGRHG